MCLDQCWEDRRIPSSLARLACTAELNFRVSLKDPGRISIFKFQLDKLIYQLHQIVNNWPLDFPKSLFFQ